MTLEPRRDVDRLAVGQRHDRFLDVHAATENAPEALGLALLNQGVDLEDVDFEQAFDRRGDLVLGRRAGDAEDDLVLLRQDRGLLGDHRSQDGVVVLGGGLSGGHYAASFSAKRASIASTAALVSTSLSARRMS